MSCSTISRRKPIMASSIMKLNMQISTEETMIPILTLTGTKMAITMRGTIPIISKCIVIIMMITMSKTTTLIRIITTSMPHTMISGMSTTIYMMSIMDSISAMASLSHFTAPGMKRHMNSAMMFTIMIQYSANTTSQAST